MEFKRKEKERISNYRNLQTMSGRDVQKINSNRKTTEEKRQKERERKRWYRLRRKMAGSDCDVNDEKLSMHLTKGCALLKVFKIVAPDS